MNFPEFNNFERKLEKLFQKYQQLLSENLALRKEIFALKKECALLSEKNEKAIANIKHIVGQLREGSHG